MFDKLIAFLLLILTSPLMVVAMAALAVANRGKVWFTQRRPGYQGRLFTVIKFRTMTDQRDDNGDLLPDSRRLTPLGRFIRRTSVDELPQLLNVLKGDMSLVGPRPLLAEYLPLYNDAQRRRHEVKPGITGWAQVNGRNTITWEQKFAYDTWYVDNISFRVDMRIILKTIMKVLRSEGISSETSATMENFKGNQ